MCFSVPTCEVNDIHPGEVLALQERRAITDTGLLIRAMAVLALVIAGFALHSVLHVAPSIVALVGAGAMLLVTNVDVAEVLPEVEWSTLVFFMGLFAMVAGLVHTGVIGALGSVAESAFGDNWFAAATALLFGSSIVGAFVDNIPYTATMTPVVESMAAQAPDAETGQALWWAFALGACFSAERHCDRRERQRRRHRHCTAGGSPDQLLAVHPLRHRRHAAQHRPGLGLRLAALLLNPAIDGRRQFSSIR